MKLFFLLFIFIYSCRPKSNSLLQVGHLSIEKDVRYKKYPLRISNYPLLGVLSDNHFVFGGVRRRTRKHSRLGENNTGNFFIVNEKGEKIESISLLANTNALNGVSGCSIEHAILLYSLSDNKKHYRKEYSFSSKKEEIKTEYFTPMGSEIVKNGKNSGKPFLKYDQKIRKYIFGLRNNKKLNEIKITGLPSNLAQLSSEGFTDNICFNNKNYFLYQQENKKNIFDLKILQLNWEERKVETALAIKKSLPNLFEKDKYGKQIGVKINFHNFTAFEHEGYEYFLIQIMASATFRTSENKRINYVKEMFSICQANTKLCFIYDKNHLAQKIKIYIYNVLAYDGKIMYIYGRDYKNPKAYLYHVSLPLEKIFNEKK